MTLRVRPILHEQANEFVRAFHRHHKRTVGAILCAAVEDDGRLCGVAIAGRPVAPALQDGRTLEINRVCTDGTRNACSMLYGAIRRAGRALGYDRIVTYTLPEEGGASLRAAGFRLDKTDAGGPASSWHNRPGRTVEPIGDDLVGGKWRWAA
ncbi:MAG TPA: XF1762 family protein [Zeimonas sp.]